MFPALHNFFIYTVFGFYIIFVIYIFVMLSIQVVFIHWRLFVKLFTSIFLTENFMRLLRQCICYFLVQTYSLYDCIARKVRFTVFCLVVTQYSFCFTLNALKHIIYVNFILVKAQYIIKRFIM